MTRTMPLFVLCFGLSACAADSRPDLVREVDALAKTGTPFTDAGLALQSAGFQCGPEADDAITHCNRGLSHRLLATMCT